LQSEKYYHPIAVHLQEMSTNFLPNPSTDGDEEDDEVLTDEIKKYETLNDIYYREAFPSNKDRFKAMKSVKERSRLAALKAENQALEGERRSSLARATFQNQYDEPFTHSMTKRSFAGEQDFNMRSSNVRGSNMRPSMMRQVINDGRQSIAERYSVIRQSVVNVTKAVVDSLPAPVTDAIAEARKGFVKVNKLSGPPGEIPVPLGFAYRWRFWEMLFWAGILGMTLSGFGLLLAVRIIY